MQTISNNLLVNETDEVIRALCLKNERMLIDFSFSFFLFTGNLDMVKLLAGSYHVDVNVKSHGGYTPLHLACQYGHQVISIASEAVAYCSCVKKSRPSNKIVLFLHNLFSSFLQQY